VKAARRGITAVMAGPSPLTLSLLMIAFALLTAGGLWVLIKRGQRGRGILMIAAGLVMLGNVLIWEL
jgi:hypothetical protein